METIVYENNSLSLKFALQRTCIYKGIVYFHIINLSEDHESVKLRVTEKFMHLC